MYTRPGGRASAHAPAGGRPRAWSVPGPAAGCVLACSSASPALAVGALAADRGAVAGVAAGREVGAAAEAAPPAPPQARSTASGVVRGHPAPLRADDEAAADAVG